MELTDFRHRLKYLRKKRQLTLVQLSKITGISPTHISSLERGIRMPSLLFAQKLASGLQVPLAELYETSNASSYQLPPHFAGQSMPYRELSLANDQIVEAYRAYEFPADWHSELLLASRSETDGVLKLAWTFLNLQKQHAPLSAWIQVFAEFIQLLERDQLSMPTSEK
ncbi:MAG: Helix-turn-helix domain [Bacilli bacterium]|nr:Helix-turn-helix domain [Bacilli bacterium]